VSTGCTARLIGKSTLIANKALGTSTPGGAVAVYSQLDIAGPLCAQDNHASAPGGGFLTAYRLSVVTFSDPATANVNGNTPRDIVIFGGVPFGDPPGRILCGSSLTSWVGGTSFVGYTITGQVCACDEAFSNGTTTTCTSCPLGWSTSICACEVSCGQDIVTTCDMTQPFACTYTSIVDHCPYCCSGAVPCRRAPVRSMLMGSIMLALSCRSACSSAVAPSQAHTMHT